MPVLYLRMSLALPPLLYQIATESGCTESQHKAPFVMELHAGTHARARTRTRAHRPTRAGRERRIEVADGSASVHVQDIHKLGGLHSSTHRQHVPVPGSSDCASLRRIAQALVRPNQTGQRM